MRGFFRPLACAFLLAMAVPAAATADALSDYVAARNTAIAASAAAAKAGKSSDEAVVKREEAAIKDLGKRLAAIVGPQKFKGLGSPGYTLQVLVYGDDEPTPQLDGIVFMNRDVTTRILVTPDAVFQAWLSARAKDKDAPAALGAGLKSAVMTTEFFGNALASDGGSFVPYVELPLAGVPGETAFAVLGLQVDDIVGNALPSDIAIVRIADGKAMVGLMLTKGDVKSIPACDAIWKPYKAKMDALQKAVEKDNKDSDPRWEQVTQIGDEGTTAYRACFAKEAPSLPSFAAAVKRAEAFLQTARGK